jgi:co-chaperonin GroES (HSP10)
MKIKGTVRPLRDKVLISDMQFGIEKTASGIFLPSDDGKSSGIHPRWGKVWAVGPEQEDVKIGDWILIEHGRWSRGTQYESDGGEVTEIRLVDNKSILAISDQAPNDALRVVTGPLNLHVPTETS